MIRTLLLRCFNHDYIYLLELAGTGLSRFLTYGGIDLSEPEKMGSHSFGSVDPSHGIFLTHREGELCLDRDMLRSLFAPEDMQKKLYSTVQVIHPEG